jgi:hypothetical protein
MRKRYLAVLAPLLGLMAFSVPAAGAATKHQVNVTIRDAAIATQGKTTITAGLVSGQPYGPGVESTSTQVIKRSSSAITIKGRGTLYFKAGTLTTTLLFTVTPTQGGKGYRLSGAGNIVSGTGIYKGATGSSTFTSSGKSSNPITVVHVIGTVSY